MCICLVYCKPIRSWPLLVYTLLNLKPAMSQSPLRLFLFVLVLLLSSSHTHARPMRLMGLYGARRTFGSSLSGVISVPRRGPRRGYRANAGRGLYGPINQGPIQG